MHLALDLAAVLSYGAEQLERERRRKVEAAKASFAEFVRQAIASGEVEGITRVSWAPHLDAYCQSLQFQLEGWFVAYPPDRSSEEWPVWEKEHAARIERQREAWERTGATWEDGEPEPWFRYVLTQNEVDNLGPGTLKSTLAMVLACAWIWLLEPKFSFAALSGIDENVSRDSKATRQLIRSKWYRETFRIAWTDCELPPEEMAAELAPPEDEDEPPGAKKPDIDIRRDSDAVSSWATTAGGRRISRTITRGLTGQHVDGIFVDDPDDADKVFSEAERLRPQNRWTRAIETRVNCEHRTIRRVIQQRVHELDFSAYLLSIQRWSPKTPKGWVWFVIPAEYGHAPEDAPTETPWGWRDWRTTPGDLMDPVRMSAGVLADKRTKQPGYEGQFNQNPRRFGEGIFGGRYARWFIWDNEDVHALRRRPDTAIQRDELPPIVVSRSDLTRWTLSIDANNSLDPKPGSKVSALGLIVGACRDDDRFLVEDRTKVVGVSGAYLAIYAALRMWPIDLVLVELKALGAGVISELEIAIRRGWYLDPKTDERIDLLGPDGRPVNCEIETVSPGRGEDKIQRAHAALPTWEQHRTYLHDGAGWVYPHVDEGRRVLDEGAFLEITTFPRSRRKDRVDAWTQFVAKNRNEADPADDWKAMSRIGNLAARMGRR